MRTDNGLSLSASDDLPPVPLDPYETAQEVWNNRLLTEARHLLLWQVVALACLVASVFSVLTVWYVVQQQQVVTVVAEVDGNQLKRTYLTTAQTVTLPTEDMIRDQLLLWLDDVRGVTGDRLHKELVYARANAKMTAGVNAIVRSYFTETKPEVRMLTKTVSVRDATALPQEGQVWHLEWQEIETETATGAVTSTSTWRAVVTVALQLSNDVQLRLQNPYGVILTNLSWTQIKGEKQ